MRLRGQRWRRRAAATTGAVVLAGSLAVGTALAEPTPTPMPPSLAPVSGSLAELLSDLPELPAPAAAEPQLVMVHGTDLAAAERGAAETGMTRLSMFEEIGVVLAQATPPQIEAVRAEPDITFVEGEQILESFTDTSHQATRGAEAVATLTGADGNPLDGSGVTIAVLDSGIDPTHPSLSGSLGDQLLCDPVNALFCESVPPPLPTDITAEGHGTAVSAVALGDPVAVGDGREIVGAAPGATLVALGIAVPEGPPGAISLIAATAAFDWVLDNHADPCDGCPPIKVTNNSYGPAGGGDFDPMSAVVQLQQALVDEGVMSVWANGNANGDGSENRSNPFGQDPTPGIVSAASHFDDNVGERDTPGSPNISEFSSRGLASDSATWPDISAPGQEILTACPTLFRICVIPPDLDGIGEVSGTSFAAPHIAGIVAQLFQAGPDATPAEVEDAMKATAFKYDAGAPIPYVPDGPYTSSFDKGTGLVDVIAAVAALTGGDPGDGDDPGDGGPGDDDAVKHPDDDPKKHHPAG